MKIKTRFLITVVFPVIVLSIIILINNCTKSIFLARSNSFSCPATGDKWLVTTVAALNLETVRRMLKNSDWNIMIIGEKLTPQNWPEQFSSSQLFYLSFQDMMKLDLHFVRYMSYGVNAQKNIGYLVAISCGAKIIYELDGNSWIWDSEVRVYSSTQSAVDIPWLAFRLVRSPFINIYGIFGQPQIWPRGLPMDEIQNISEDDWSSLRRNDNETINAYIQQKLFDFDPDVDAIGRLMHQVADKRVMFDQDRRPIALDPFTFSPYNSQNTIHHLDAFWGLYLPVSIHPQIADIWRGFWVQRLLWDIGGHLLFTTSTVRRFKPVKNSVEDMTNQQVLHNDAGKLVRFLSSWKPTTTTLMERIQELVVALTKAKFLGELESTAVQAWLHDLSRINYKFPLPKNAIENPPTVIRVKRSAVCVTGLTECVLEVWAANEIALRERLDGDIDVFLFLSTGDGIRSNLSPATTDLRIKQARFYNATVNIVHRDMLDINPGFPSTCNYRYSHTRRLKIIPIEQERLAQAKCYNIVREYERKKNIQYQLLIRARSDSVFARLPMTFERDGKFNLNHTIIIPNEHHYHGINDRFAIGPMGFMKYYMSRWHQLSLCLSENVHPESFLAFVLKTNGIKVTTDTDISLVQIPHNKNQCH